jgi:hypothetical protein
MKLPASFISVALVLICIVIYPLSAQSPSGTGTSWYGNLTEAGLGFGIGKFKTDVINGYQLTTKNNELFFLIHTINGVKIQDRAFLGLGIGYELWQHGSFVPIFGHLSYDLQKKENPFVLSINLGYSIGTRGSTSDYQSGKGGFMAGIGLGYRQKISRTLKFIYEVFYKFQAINSSYNTIVTDSVGKVKYSHNSDYSVPNHFVGLSIGIVY